MVFLHVVVNAFRFGGSIALEHHSKRRIDIEGQVGIGHVLHEGEDTESKVLTGRLCVCFVTRVC